MARRSRQSFLKRQRERQRAEKAAEKRQKRFERHRGAPAEEGSNEGTDDAAGPAEEPGPLNRGSDTVDAASDLTGTLLDRQD